MSFSCPRMFLSPVIGNGAESRIAHCMLRYALPANAAMFRMSLEPASVVVEIPTLALVIVVALKRSHRTVK